MKQLLLFFAISSTLFLTSCEGDPGPPGPPGEPGINILGQVFEINADFTDYDANNNVLFSPFYSFPNNIEVFESDAILVYRLTGQDNSVSPPADVWTQLPYSEFFADGTGDIYQYNFNHTFFDVQFTIEGNFDVSTLGSDATFDQIFRVVVVPAEFGDASMSMEDLLEQLNIEPDDITSINN